VYVCVYVSMFEYVCMCVSVCEFVRVFMYCVHVCVCMYVCMFERNGVCLYMHTHTYVKVCLASTPSSVCPILQVLVAPA